MDTHRASHWLDERIAAYCSAHTTPPDDVQRDLIAATAEKTGRAMRMQIGADQGTFMQMLTALSGARHAVEVGTFTGYSALCIARGLPDDGQLLCCDVSDEWTSIGRPFWERAGVAHKIELKIGPGLDTLRALPKDAVIDVAFVDADKPNYRNYYDELLPRLRPNGLLMVDNTLWSGRVLDPQADDNDSVLMAAFNDMVMGDDRVATTLLPIGDGLTLIRKR
jgi:caffeoyl-CoA O-methyltransferase